MENSKVLKEYRCTCGKLLFKGSFYAGIVEVKCKHCHQLLSFFGEEILKDPTSCVSIISASA